MNGEFSAYFEISGILNFLLKEAMPYLKNYHNLAVKTFIKVHTTFQQFPKIHNKCRKYATKSIS